MVLDILGMHVLTFMKFHVQYNHVLIVAHLVLYGFLYAAISVLNRKCTA